MYFNILLNIFYLYLNSLIIMTEDHFLWNQLRVQLFDLLYRREREKHLS